ncbi:V-type ATP synthase subunit B [Streptomyces sp. JNUCC 63]
MSAPGEIEYTGVRELRGPLVVVEGVSGVGWDEFATIVLDSGERRHGLVLEVDRDLAVVQVLEDTAGMDRAGTRVAFSGTPLRIPVGVGWLGRACNGRGEPADGGPPVLGSVNAAVGGAPINPVRREPPTEPVLTGVGAIDVLTTLVRGQKLPVFSAAGLPHLELAVQIAAQATSGGEAFAVVFAGMGLTHADAAFVRDGLAERSAARELTLLLNTADDPVIERLLTPRLALTVAEHLAFVEGRHVLVVMTDMTAYSEALREVSAARGEIPARRAYPGYLYSDLASLYERCGRIRGRPGSVTVLPVLTMPAGDITHPVPDLTGYITEGQIVLSAEVHARGTYPPVDPLGSLSRLMRKGAGAGRTREDHPHLAAQLIAALARARQVRELADLIGRPALSPADHRYLDLEEAFLHRFLAQGTDENRSLDDSLDRAWEVVLTLPSSQLGMIPTALLQARRTPGEDHADREDTDVEGTPS